MSRCRDVRIESLLYAYELDLLNEPERREVEIHLLECEDCFARVEKFEIAAKLILHDREVQDAVRDEADEPAPAARGSLIGNLLGVVGRRPTLRMIPAAVLVAAIALFLILHPWHIEFNPAQEAVAEENRLAVIQFENLADAGDSTRLGEIATNLLITGLSESHYITVISSMRLNLILKTIGLQGVRKADMTVVSQLASRTGARWVLTGSILQTQPHLVISAQTISAEGGDVIASQQIVGQPGEDIFALTDRLVRVIKKDLRLPAAAYEEPDRRVADITTHSATAYLYYLEGLEYCDKLYNDEAIACFLKAVEYDSTFAMAYLELARLKSSEYIKLAVKYSAKAGQREQYLIQCFQVQFSGDKSKFMAMLQEMLRRYPDDEDALIELGRYNLLLRNCDDAVMYLRRLIAVNPGYKEAYNQLAYAYQYLNDFDNAIWAINQYITLAPNEPNPYDSRGDLYAYNGRLDKAIESYRRALDIKPEFTYSRIKLGNMYLFQREFGRAEECYRRIMRDGDSLQRGSGQSDVLNVAIVRGNFERALTFADDGLALVDSTIRGSATGLYKAMFHNQKARILALLGRCPEALQERNLALAAVHQSDSAKEDFRFVYLTAKCGDSVEAARMVKTLAATGGKADDQEFQYAYARGMERLAYGDSKEAVAYLQKAVYPGSTISDFNMHYYLGQAYLEAGRISDAVSEFERLVTVYSPDRRTESINSISLHYLLGIAYEQSQWYDRAGEQYRIFLDFWGNAYPVIPAVTDARNRLARLTSQS